MLLLQMHSGASERLEGLAQNNSIQLDWIEPVFKKTESGFKSLLGKPANINSKKVFDKESLQK